MTKNNAEAAIAVKSRKGKLVLTESDLLPEGGETQEAMTKRHRRELALLADKEGCPRAATIVAKGMARGLGTRDAPHSAKSIYDDRSKAKASGKADARQARLAREADRKAARKAKAAPKADDTRKITILDKDFTFGREGTARNKAWLACKKAKTVADYAKAGGALKYLPRWAASGAIKLG